MFYHVFFLITFQKFTAYLSEIRCVYSISCKLKKHSLKFSGNALFYQIKIILIIKALTGICEV